MTEALMLWTGVAVVLLMAADWRNWRAARCVAKMMAATGFCGIAWSVGALETVYGKWVIGALALSWVGDLLLLWRHRKVFLGGIGAFLLAHIVFAGAFWVRGIHPGATALALVGFTCVGVAVYRYLAPHLPAAMKWPVVLYIAAITCMTAGAVGTSMGFGNMSIAVGAVAFMASDIAVARDRFVVETFSNRLWGTPLYFCAQVVLALTPQIA